MPQKTRCASFRVFVEISHKKISLQSEFTQIHFQFPQENLVEWFPFYHHRKHVLKYDEKQKMLNWKLTHMGAEIWNCPEIRKKPENEQDVKEK